MFFLRIIKESDFRKEIKSSPACGYLFFGEEDYLKAYAINTARELICPDPTFAFFNEMKLEALDFTAQKLLDALTPLPMMADRKLVTVSGLSFNAMKPSELEDLCEVLAELPAYDYNVLIINVASDCLDPGYIPKNPSTTLKKLCEHLTAVQFERSTPAKLAAWTQKHFAHNGVEASPSFCAQMVEYCGHTMFILANEIDKLSYYVLSHGETVATEEAMRLVCVAANEYDTFDFTNAIMEGHRSRALEILADYRFRRIEPVFILGDVTRVICETIAVRTLSAEGVPAREIGSGTYGFKMHEYRVSLYQTKTRSISSERLRSALNACLAADASLKLSPQGYTALERLICTL